LVSWPTAPSRSKLTHSLPLIRPSACPSLSHRFPDSAELIAAMQLAQKPIFTMPNGNKQAMAWVNNIGGGNPNLHPVIMKNGGTAGFGTGIAINPTKDAAIFIGMNQAGAQPIAKGVEILRHLP
jgi:CubicO group peptidase (beta-lactamase class C family)